MNIKENSEITLREITKETVWDILQLTPADDQKQFVASNAESIAEAYFQPNYAWFRAIYADEIPVGFVKVGMDKQYDFCLLWRFMIDKNYQKNGFGSKALNLLFSILNAETNFKSIIVVG